MIGAVMYQYIHISCMDIIYYSSANVRIYNILNVYIINIYKCETLTEWTNDGHGNCQSKVPRDI